MAKYIVCPQDGYPTLLEEIGMRKITPIILTMIMLMSAFASIGWAELDETKTSNEVDARAGPDASITDGIKEPRATSVDTFTGETNHEIFAGNAVNFELFIENVGTEDITQMGITVTVHEDADGQPGGALGPVATDASGAALIWQNNDVICDDAFACPQTSLAAGAVLDGGAYLMVVQGTIVSWLPDVGDYQIKVDIDAEGANEAPDVEPDNDMELQFVSVVDWTDVIVDLRWFSGKDVEGGSGAKDFSLTVSTTGSIPWEARDITLEMELSGELADAQYFTDADGNNQTGHDGHGSDDGIDNGEERSDPLDIDGTPFVLDEIGTYGEVTTYEAGDEKGTNTTGNRWNMRMGDVWTFNGTVIPSGAVTSGNYKIEVLMTNYTVYGQYSPECDRESNQSGEADEDTLNTTLTVTDYCEVSKQSDDYPATSEDMIDGNIENYHDMSVINLVLNQGYSTDEVDANGFPTTTSSNPGLTGGPIQPGLATVQARVSHNGNDPAASGGAQEYTWNVTFDITSRATGAVTSLTSNECFNGESPGGMSYADVGGTSGPIEADACVSFMFTPGSFDVVATVTFEHRGTGGVDQNGFNDKMQIGALSVLNNRPTVSLNIGTEGNIIVGEATEVQFEAVAYDVEDPTGGGLIYNWTYPGSGTGGEFASSMDGQGKDFSSISLQIFGVDWVGYQSVSVTVSDNFSSTSATVSFNVWNQVVSESTTASGVKMTYDLTYALSAPYSVNLSDSDAGYTGQSLTGYTGTYDSVAVLDFVPSTSYDGTYVLNQAVSIEYNSSDFEPTSVWYVDTNGIWAEITQTSNTLGTVSTITLDLGVGSGTLSPGKIVLMGGELIQAVAPEAHPMGFTMSSTIGGNIGMAWSYMGSYTAADWVEIVLCEGASGCAEPEIIKPGITMTAHSLSGQGQTTHGITYYATIQVCNDAGCNVVIGQANATADSEVDGNPTATAVTVANGDNVWTVSWTATGDTTDVKNWMVCYDDSSWTVAGDMPANCVNAADGATSADVPMSTAPGTKKFYFTAVPMDALGNYDTAVSLADVDYVGAVDAPGQDTGENVGSNTDVEGAVPAWTWGVIIGIVVVAFVAGAFILSRGGDGDEGKDWDY
mgnify:CR=1 FL=1